MKSWIVRLKCTVYKDVVCENCTEDQAAEHPYEFATDETETEQIDWEVLSVEPNP